MPFRFQFDAPANVALVTMLGEVEGPDLLRASAELIEQPEWAPGMDVIWDGRVLSGLVLMPGELERHVQFKLQHPEAFEGGEDALVFEKAFHKLAAQLYAVLARAQGREARAYDTVREALRALGHPDFPSGLLPHPEAEAL